MTAAQELFLQRGFEKVTAREIAVAAGTTPAMIHYYFENKMGLFRAMMQAAIEPFTRMLTGAVTADAKSEFDLARLVEGHLRVAAANSWLASLIVNDVLPESGQFRAAFTREIAGRMLPMLVQLIEHGRASGHLRSDIDPQLTALSILSLNVFPLISRPITQPILGFKLEGEDFDRLISHTTRLLFEGIGVKEKSK